MNFYELLLNRGQPSGEGMTHFERLFAAKLAGGGEIKELEGVPPLTFKADGSPLISWSIYGNTVQNGTPTPDNPIQPSECGDLETSGAKAGQYKIPISSANTTTPVYLGEVESTRRIKKLVLTGEEFVYVYASADIAFRINTSDAMLNYRYCACTHFVYQRTPGSSKIDGVTAGAGDYNLYFTFSSSSAAQFGVVAGYTNSFKAYLAQQYANGTPVTIWYVLATPTTGIVNEPLMRIGDYADTLSKTQAGVEIPTIKGNNTLDIDTTLKPSNVYIKYKD